MGGAAAKGLGYGRGDLNNFGTAAAGLVVEMGVGGPLAVNNLFVCSLGMAENPETAGN